MRYGAGKELGLFMEHKYSVKLSVLVDELELEKVYPPQYEEITVVNSAVNRPGYN